MAEKIHDLFDMSYVDVQEWLKKTDIIMIPVGSLEQHGPHCPLGTDSITAWEVTKRAAEKAGVPHTPLIWMGYSPHHMREAGQGAGTITLRAETYRRLLYDVARSLIHHGFNKIVFVAGHGSLIKVIDEVLRTIKYETGAFIAWYKAFAERDLSLVKDIVESPPEDNPGWHSGEMETSQDMAYNPMLVKMERALKADVHAPRWLSEKFIKRDGSASVTFEGAENIVIPMEHHEYSDYGVVGDPFKATKEKGERLFERFASHLAKFLDEVKGIQVTIKNREFTLRA
ncbi:MAG: creatininase family protein [Candidatus Geothermarchaeales archaeon]